MIIKKSQKLLNFINKRRKLAFKNAGVTYPGDWTWDQVNDVVLNIHYKDYRVLVLKHPPEEVYGNNITNPAPPAPSFKVVFKKPPRRVINA